MSGNEAVAQGAIDAGCRFYAGYPITPQNELTAYMSEHMYPAGGVFVQAESELAAINMVFGAAATGVRAMTSSSSPGVSLKQEGISYMAGCELPGVIVNMMRGGPGLGNISPSQADYFQATKGGGHGDYHCIVLTPASAQEAYDDMFEAFALADRYRGPVMILSDGMIAQMMEPVACGPANKKMPTAEKKDWALTGCAGRQPNVIRSLYLKDGVLESLNQRLQDKYARMRQEHQRWEEYLVDDAEVVLVAYGAMARICRSVVNALRQDKVKIGMVRPQTVWPFPEKAFGPLLKKKRKFLAVEMSYGQMVEDVRLAVNGQAPVEFYGRAGGGIPTEEQIIACVKKLLKK
jgi:2-oxoglutarate ferredoxin oxidoreductase subunit alpha